MNIPDEDIESAASAISAELTCDGQPFPTEFHRRLARVALEAVYPPPAS